MSALENLAQILDVRTWVLRDALVRAGVSTGAYHLSKGLEKIIYGKDEKGSRHGGQRRLALPEGRKATRLKYVPTASGHDNTDSRVDGLAANVQNLREAIALSDHKIAVLHSNHADWHKYRDGDDNQALLEDAAREGKKVFDLKKQLAAAERDLTSAKLAQSVSQVQRESLDPQFRRYARDFRRRQRAIRLVKESYLTKYARWRKKY